MPTLTRITGYLYNALGATVTTGKVRITAQQDFISVDGTKVAPFSITVDLSTTAGLVDVQLYATVGATPSGLAYFVEFDPTPTDLSKPIKTKDGYWSNYWTVPNTGSVIPLGNFSNAIRGAPLSNYMPAQGTVDTGTDTIYIGAAPGSNTTKRLRAYTTAANKPEIRFNFSTSKWEFSHDGSTFYTVGAEQTLNLNNDTVLIGNAGDTTKSIKANQLATDKPTIRFNQSTGKWEISHDGVDFYIPAGMLTLPTADLLTDWLYLVGGI